MALALLLAACSSNGPGGAPRDPETLIRIAEDDAKSLDPQAMSDLASLRVAADQFEGLTRFNADGQAEPGLARDWTVSPDGRVWRFRLRERVRFGDGHPITAATFVAGFRRLRDPAAAAPTASLFDPVADVAADAPDVVRVTLSSPFPALIELMAHPAMAALPLHRAGWLQDRPMAASGAYRVESWTLNDRIVLGRNPAWQGPRPGYPRLIWRPVTDGLTAIRQIETGQADVAGEFPSARLEDLKARHGKAIRIAPYRGTYYFAFNTRLPPFQDKRVRQALSLAVERQWIADRLMATGVSPAWGIVPPGVAGDGGYRPAWAGLSRRERLARARALLASAGYGPARPLVFDVRFNSDTDHRRVAVALAAMWRELGVEARLLNSEASLHFASLRRGDFMLARSGWIGDLSAPENFLAVHRADAGPINYSGYADARYDAALAAAHQQADPAARRMAMRAAESIVAQDAPVLPLYYYVSKAFLSPRIDGWRDNPANIHPSRTIFPAGGAPAR